MTAIAPAAQAVFALIAARAANGVIGRDGGLPWRIAADMRHFRRLTLGKPVLMGRKTYQSIGRPLPQRANIVISGDPDFRPEGVEAAATIDAGCALALAAARAMQADEVMVIGGEAIYRALLPRASRLYLTEIEAEIDGDARFPEFDTGEWRRASSEPGPRDEAVAFAYRFETWTRND